jgi:hypothetical protein
LKMIINNNKEVMRKLSKIEENDFLYIINNIKLSKTNVEKS